ncbi:hypothetical protein TNCV_1133441 [Trichonephila clavipes]|nr:hypothetical protein TNCV_1133441 [Trichonephila clavipes]
MRLLRLNARQYHIMHSCYKWPIWITPAATTPTITYAIQRDIDIEIDLRKIKWKSNIHSVHVSSLTQQGFRLKWI